jgi:hypothetical protein
LVSIATAEAFAGREREMSDDRGNVSGGDHRDSLRRKQLAPEANEAFENLGRAVFADGARPVSGRLDDLAGPAGHVDGGSG